MNIVLYIIDIFFTIDIFISFNRAYVDSDFLLVESRCQIFKNYCFGWFLIDVISTVPVEVFIYNSP